MIIEGLTRQQELQLDKLLNNYRLTPMTLACKLNPSLIPTHYLSYISVRIANAISKGNGRLIISLPPRHGKSELVTKNTPIWTLENFGQKNVILCSYGGDLSTDFGRKVRNIINDNKHLLNLRIRRDAERANNWLTEQNGAMYSVGLGGPITGRGADVLIIDDYIKEIKEALSQNQRDYIWDWFVTTAFTRLEPNATVIIVATRWHHDDLIGRILKKSPGIHPWENIVIPAFAEPKGYIASNKDTHHITDQFGRKFGEPLFEEHFPTRELNDRKSTLGSFFFNALYQQRPENDAGKLTDKNWLKYIPLPPKITPAMKLVRVWDLAATEDGGDYMVGLLGAYDTEHDVYYILDIRRGQFGPMGVELAVVETAHRDGKNIPIRIEREPGSSGKLLVANYAAKPELRGYNVQDHPANDNKLYRAQPFLAAVEAGRVYILKASWNDQFETEYDDYPGGDHDDQIDCAGAAYTILTGKKLLRASWGRSSEQSSQSDQNTKKNNQFNMGNNKTSIILPNGKVYIPAPEDNIVQVISKSNGVSWGR